ncbi:hypothetical protein IWZ00DRAFT_502012 [Phyllosticta capitalensis]|uniref:Uncharacterized protein n=1 Tax=Phyllosticta capitalensis TaxID=121624 RepID=A0ABR1YTT2_9PEZI
MRRIASATARKVFSPVFRPIAPPSTPLVSAARKLPLSISRPSNNVAPFSTSAALRAEGKKGGRPQRDRRVTLIRYFLFHPKTPRPLRFSRGRYLRHWTIHRAWMLFQRKMRREQELELEAQYNSMNAACEALRLMDENGHKATPGGKEVGRLFRLAMMKTGRWSEGFPIEYARPQVETPPRDGWNHNWRRGG